MNLKKVFVELIFSCIFVSTIFANNQEMPKETSIKNIQTKYLNYDDVIMYYYSNTLSILVKKDNKWGFIDKEGNKITDNIYNDVIYFSKDTIRAVKNKKFGIINSKGEVVVPFKYLSIEPTKQEDMFIVSQGTIKEKKLGLINRKQELLLPLEYEKIDYKKDYYIIFKNHKYGLANSTAKIVVPVTFEQVKNISEKYALVRVEGRWHFFDKKTQKILKEAFDKIDKVYGDNSYLKIRQKGEFFILDERNMQKIISSDYKYIGVYSSDLIKVQKNGKYGLMNEKGSLVVPTLYNDINTFSKKDKLFRVRKGKDNLVGIVDSKGNEVVPAVYIDDRNFLKGYYLVKSEDKKWHIFDLQEKKDSKLKEIGTSFDNVSFAKNNKIAVQKNAKWILIDKNNPKKALQTYDYDYITGYSCDCDGEIDNYFITEKNEKYGLIKPDGQVLIKPIYDSLKPWTTASVKVKENGKYGVVDFKGNVVLEPTYDRLDWLYGMSAIAIGNIGDKWQLLDIYSKPISKLYNKVFLAVDGDKNLIIMDNKTKLRGVINNKGKELFDTKYKAASSFSGDNIELVNTKGETAYFDENAKQIVPFMKNIHKTVEDGMLLVKKYEEKYSRKIINWWIYDIKTKKLLFAKDIKENKGGKQK